MQTAEVVIIGGGCVGTSVAYHLAVLGCTDVILLEAGTLGGGATSKAAGGIRVQHADMLNSTVVQRSLEEFTRFEDITGVPIGLRQVGYLFLLDSPRDLAAFQRAVAAQHSIGIRSEIVGPDRVRELLPPVSTEDIIAAAFCPDDGYATPEAVVQGYAKAARRLGVSIRPGCAVTGITVNRGQVGGVETDDGAICSRAVVCAAGLESRRIARQAGFELPVHGEARTIYYSGKSGGIPDAAPLTIDFSTGFYFHREGPGLLFAGRQREIEDLYAPAVRRLPAIADLPIQSSWWGYYDMSPDGNAMIGVGPVAEFYYATGFSGHGFQQSPAAGEYVAELVLGRKPTLDLTPLAASRFDEGHTRPEAFII